MRNHGYTTKFSKRLMVLRTKKVYQDKLSKLAGLHRAYISRIKQGTRNPSLKNIQKLAYTLKINPKDFST